MLCHVCLPMSNVYNYRVALEMVEYYYLDQNFHNFHCHLLILQRTLSAFSLQYWSLSKSDLYSALLNISLALIKLSRNKNLSAYY